MGHRWALLPPAHLPQSRAPSPTRVFGADRAALIRKHFGPRTVLGVLTDHFIAQDIALVADADLARLGFPYFSFTVPDTVLHAGDWWDWGKNRRRSGGVLSGAPETLASVPLGALRRFHFPPALPPARLLLVSPGDSARGAGPERL